MEISSGRAVVINDDRGAAGGRAAPSLRNG